MKITNVRWVPYEFELARPIGDANHPQGSGRAGQMAVFIDTDEGVTGVSVTFPQAAGAMARLVPLVVGEDPRGVRGLWQRMVDVAFKDGNHGPIGAAIAGIDAALWDTRARLHGVPLWRELGGTDPRVKVYASGLDTPLDDDAIGAYYRRMAVMGITGGKLKIGLDPDDDLRRIGIMRDALAVNGARPSLMVDVNEYWSPKQAIRRMREIERHFEITWCEEPARRWDYEGLKQVSRAIGAAVATGENLSDPSEFLPLLVNQAADVLQIGLKTTGITGALRVAEIAATFERPVSLMNCPGRFMAHVATVMPHHIHMEVLDAGRDAGMTCDHHISGGWLVLGDQPGCGITFDEQRLQEMAAAPTGAILIASYRRAPEAGVREGSNRPPKI